MPTILVVDDSEVDRRLVAGMLTQEDNHTIHCANSGEEAVSFLQRSSPDLVLADLFMPGMDGIELLQIITNAVNHGNLEVSSELRQGDDSRYRELIRQRSNQEPYCGRRVHIKTRMSDRDTVFVIRDEGPGFDVAGLPDPMARENLERASGRGILLMRMFMDEALFSERGNEVTLVKWNPAKQPGDHRVAKTDVATMS
jgi:CheY-like chemotaxis protein